jgi:2-oxoglutarate dehydrogenase E1 component
MAVSCLLSTFFSNGATVSIGRRAFRPRQVAAALMSTKVKTHPSESFLSGTSSVYAEQMLAAYKRDPESVHVSWRSYFENLERGMKEDQGAFEPLPTIQSNAAATATLMVRN